MKEHKDIIECECHSHRIEVEYDKIDEDYVYINLWYMGRGHNIRLWDRIKIMWDMLTIGYVHDGYLLTEAKTKQLRDALDTILDDKKDKGV